MSNKTQASTVQAKIPSIINNNRHLAATVSKLNADNEDKTVPLTMANLPDISESIQDKIKNNETIVKLFPDIELSIQILVSSILSPNDMTTTNIIYDTEGMEIPSDIKLNLLNTIKSYISNNYDLENKLPTIIRESMFTKGAYIEAIIPEASVDEMINVADDTVSVEHLIETATSKAILGEEKIDITATISLEGIDDQSKQNKRKIYNTSIDTNYSEEDLGIFITDNIGTIGLNKKIADRNKSTLRDMFSTVSTEEINVLDNLFKKTPINSTSEVVHIKTKDEAYRESVGKPMIIKIPVEATIPVHTTGDPTNHVGYFVMLNNNGTPISDVKNFTSSEDENDNNNPFKLKSKTIIDKASAGINGYSKEDPKLENMEELYSQVVSQKLKHRLASGILGNVVEIADSDTNIYRIMLSRVLTKQKTKILFLPADIVSFYAFNYRSNGTGESLLETISVLSSIRAILLFSRIMANVKNSVTTTEVNATLDDNDDDPNKTMSKIISEVMKSRQTQLPIGVTRVEDIVDWTKKVGYRFNFKHPTLPNMDITTNEDNTSKIVPDAELDEEIRKQILMAFAIPPKAVEDGYDSDFATTIVQSNVLFTKRVTVLQKTLMKMTTNHIQILLKNDMDIYEVIYGLIKKNMKQILKYLNMEKDILKNITEEVLCKYLTNKYIESITLSLPTIEEHSDTNMKEAFDSYKDSVENMVDLFFSSDSFPVELSGEFGDKVEDFKIALQNTILRKWLSDNNYVPEFIEATTVNNEGQPLYDVYGDYQQYLENMAEILLQFNKDTNKKIKKIDKKIDKLDGDDNEEDDNEEDNSNQEDDNTADTPDDLKDNVDDNVDENKDTTLDDETPEPDLEV